LKEDHAQNAQNECRAAEEARPPQGNPSPSRHPERGGPPSGGRRPRKPHRFAERWPHRRRYLRV